ncbi:MAG: RsmD family RNA methyltransferase [Myxococcota bacterium]
MRIIAGALGGRRIEGPRGRTTRPTRERVREALFSALGDLSGVRVVDLFAGSGALGLEALSRGAAHAVFIEKDRRAMSVIRANVAALGLQDRTTLRLADVYRGPVGRSGASVSADLWLVDPPYRCVGEAGFAAALGRWLPGAPPSRRIQLVLEHERRASAPVLAALGAPARARRYGDTVLSFYLCAGADDAR